MPTYVDSLLDSFHWLTATTASSTEETLTAGAGWNYSHPGNANILSMDGPYSGDRAFRFNGTNRYIYKNFSSIAEIYINIHIYFLTLPTSAAYFLILQDGANPQLELQVNLSGDIILTRNGTTLATASTAVTHSQWYFFQMKFIINNTTGAGTIRINNTQVINFSGDTQNSANASVSRLFLINGNVGNSANAWTHLVVYTDSGSWPLAECRFKRVAPDAAGNYTQFTPLSSTNVSNIDEQQPDSDTTYNSSTVVGNFDTFGTNANLSNGDTILLTQESSWIKKTDAGARSARQVLRIGSTDYESASYTLTNSYVRYTNVRAVNPATSVAWIYSDINALEVGYKDQA